MYVSKMKLRERFFMARGIKLKVKNSKLVVSTVLCTIIDLMDITIFDPTMPVTMRAAPQQRSSPRQVWPKLSSDHGPAKPALARFDECRLSCT
jgi:hypothetical protein